MQRLICFLPVLVLSYALTAQDWNRLPSTPVYKWKNDTMRLIELGGIPNGHFLNTSIINEGISKLSKRGGGVFYVPAGLWHTGPIVLQSNVNLHLAVGATLLFTDDLSQFKLVPANWEGLPQMRNQSPVSATGATNIAITGKGILDGNGDAWRMVKKDKLTESNWKKLLQRGGVLSDDKKTWYPSASSFKGSTFTNPGVIETGKDSTFYQSVKDFLRPNMVLLTECKNILLEGVTFQNSPAWCLHPLMSENLVVRNISVKNPWYAQNGDGIDVESCKNVWIENSVFDVGDDALCMKSGRDAAGRQRAMPTENVYIKNCTVYASHGGFVIGSEMSGGVRNVYVSNCTFVGSDIGLRFKTTRGRGGVVENIFIRDIYMKDIPGEAILFDMYYMARDPIALAGETRALPAVELKPVNETTPVFRNFRISNVYCSNASTGIFVRGLPEMAVKNVVLENMVLQATTGMDIQEAEGLTFSNITLITEKNNPVIDVTHSTNLSFNNVRTPTPAQTFIRVAGDRSRSISIQNSDDKKATKAVVTELGATPSSITLK